MSGGRTISPQHQIDFGKNGLVLRFDEPDEKDLFVFHAEPLISAVCSLTRCMNIVCDDAEALHSRGKIFDPTIKEAMLGIEFLQGMARALVEQARDGSIAGTLEEFEVTGDDA